MKDILIGGAWPYANNSLHIGHLAALLPADVIARYHRGCGNRVIYVSGTDCHGTPITVRAKKEGVTPESIALKYHEEFVNSFKNLDFSYDFYTATMTSEHKKHVQEFFETILEQYPPERIAFFLDDISKDLPIQNELKATILMDYQNHYKKMQELQLLAREERRGWNR